MHSLLQVRRLRYGPRDMHLEVSSISSSELTNTMIKFTSHLVCVLLSPN